MSSISNWHKELNSDGVGKCSVPMWLGGLPAGFCDKEAYGKHINKGIYDGYVPTLACPEHGGPQKTIKELMKNRISWEEYALKLAEVAALRSEDPWIQVGAIALRHNNTIAGSGYNGLPSKVFANKEFWENRDFRRKFIIHAESNCLNYVEPGEARLIAITLSPCVDCVKLIASKKISKIIYKEEYTTDPESLNDVKKLCNKFRIKLNKYED